MDLRSPCGGAIGQLAYYYDGNIYTCDEGRMLAEMGNDSFKIGNVYENSYTELMQSDTTKAMCISSCTECLPYCRNCVYMPYCGTCPVINLAQDNNIFAKNPQEYRCKIYKEILNILFDYIENRPEVIEILEKTGKLISSQGAKIIDLEDKGINTPCIIEKSNGSTTYATRDLAAILYRARNYNFDKALYVTSYEQVLHFKQVFATAKYLGLDEKYIKGLEHVSFGMVLLPTGKMSTREGNIVKLEELLNEAIERAKEIIEQKNPELENKEEVAKKVGIGAIIFNDLSNSRVKDEVFDWNNILNFQGETGPYIQYTYVRTKSVLEKAGIKIDNISFNMLNFDSLEDTYSQNIIKLLYDFHNILIQVTEKNEPSILSRYLIELAKAYSVFYNENRIMVEDVNIKNSRIYLTFAVGKVLKIGANLLGIEMPEKM